MDSTETKSMYAKIGGKAAVEAVVGNFYERVLGDLSLAPFFDGTDMDRQRRHQVAFVSMALGGPKEYTGKAMREAHAGRGIERQQFASVAGHLTEALRWGGVGEQDVGTIIGVVAGLEDDVLGN